MSLQTCIRCGKETKEGELYCLECQAGSGGRRTGRRLWIFTFLFSGVLLFLALLFLWHGGISLGIPSLDRLWEKPAAVINGDPIAKSELQGRVRLIQGIVERQYGKEVFTGERGRALLASLREEVLNGILEEKLMDQEARKLGIRVTDGQIRERLERIIKEVFGSERNFQQKMKEEGMSQEDLRSNLRTLLVLEELKKAKTPLGANPDISFNAWMVQTKQKAELVIYDRDAGGMTLPSRGGCCGLFGSPPGPGGPAGGGRTIDPKIEKEAQKAGLEAFQKTNPNENGVTAKVTDYGCHVQVDIEKEGKVVKSYSYQMGRVFEIS